MFNDEMQRILNKPLPIAKVAQAILTPQAMTELSRFSAAIMAQEGNPLA